MISTLLLVGALSVNAQTYCFKNEFKVSEDGARIKTSCTYHYWTFTNNMQNCYESDKDGNSTSSIPMVYKYVRNNNGIIEYNCKIEDPINNLYGGPNRYSVNKSIYLSSDYNRINIIEKSILDKITYTWVYERVSSPEQENAPRQLY